MKKTIISIVLVVFLFPWDAFSAQVGSPAPSFSVKDLSNSMVTLSDLRSKVVLLTFWAPWCAPCRDELQEFERLFTKYRDKGFVVIGISVETSKNGVSSFLKKVPVTFPVVIDATDRLAESYRITSLPASFLVDRTGVVRKRYWGFEKSSLSNFETDISVLIQK